MSGSPMETERQRLEFTKEEMAEILSRTEKIFGGLVKKYGDDPRLLENMMSLYGTKIKNMKTGLGKPYFARIDFRREDGSGEPLYIGKMGLYDRNSEMLITDWRAPVSSLYYNSNLGQASYDAPDGAISGELRLKRQIIIENGELVSIFDVDSVSDDELLRPYLGASADSRLKNIVASIQKEQNDIIRKPLGTTLIVQGVAGSGKTTVALHRIAYLVYNYSRQYQGEQFLVIGPNKFFINYISSVLPDLDVGNAGQLTYEEFARDFIGESFTIQDPALTLRQAIAGSPPDDFLAYKTSLAYRDALDRFFDCFENELPSGEGLVVNGFPVLTKEEVLSRLKSYPAEDLFTRVQMTVQALSASLTHDAALYSRIKEHFRGNGTESKAESDRLAALQMDTLKQQQSGFSKALKKYLNVSSVKVLGLYKKFLQTAPRYTGDTDGDRIARLQKSTLRDVNRKTVEFEDVPALLYLKLLLTGSGRFSAFAHTVVDEAQDFGLFHFFVLKKILCKSTFSIFGDLTQGIYGYRAVSAWEPVRDQVFGGECGILRLEKSYRTTIEIMEAANRISRHLGLDEGKPVIRHGGPVRAFSVSREECADKICALLEEYRQKEYRSVAVICKSSEDSREMAAALRERGAALELISEDNERYDGGICAMTCYLAKGLEFDGVILWDGEVYSPQSDLDMKLLYVAMTRALHQLDILFAGSLPGPLCPLAFPGDETPCL